jgi:hypothetical protein
VRVFGVLGIGVAYPSGVSAVLRPAVHSIACWNFVQDEWLVDAARVKMPLIRSELNAAQSLCCPVLPCFVS